MNNFLGGLSLLPRGREEKKMKELRCPYCGVNIRFIINPEISNIKWHEVRIDCPNCMFEVLWVSKSRKIDITSLEKICEIIEQEEKGK